MPKCPLGILIFTQLFAQMPKCPTPTENCTSPNTLLNMSTPSKYHLECVLEPITYSRPSLTTFHPGGEFGQFLRHQNIRPNAQMPIGHFETSVKFRPNAQMPNLGIWAFCRWAFWNSPGSTPKCPNAQSEVPPRTNSLNMRCSTNFSTHRSRKIS